MFPYREFDMGGGKLCEFSDRFALTLSGLDTQVMLQPDQLYFVLLVLNLLWYSGLVCVKSSASEAIGLTTGVFCARTECRVRLYVH